MTNHCVVGGKETDNPFAANFWTARTPPDSTTPYTAIDPAARNAWGVDLNRNNTFATIFDGYIGASYVCISDVYAGPAEASEPEIKNEFWIADTFDNIKFSNNIHSFGGYFMWAPGAYLPDRGEGDAVHANIGVEKYFFEAGDRILNRIKERPEHGDPPGAHGADRGRPVLGGRQQRRRALVQPRRHRVQLRDGRGPVLHHHAGARRRPGRRRSGSTRTPAGSQYLKPGDSADGSAPAGRTRRRGRSRPWSGRIAPEPAPERARSRSRWPPRTRPATRVEGAALQTGVGFQPDYATEGKHEALEFAAGNYGLLESALRVRARRRGPAGQDDRAEVLDGADRGHVRVDQRAVSDPVHHGRVAGRTASPRCGTPPARASPARRST